VTLLFAAGLGMVIGCQHTPPSSTSPGYAPLTAAALDVGSIFPKPAIARIGTEQVLTTAVFQRADRQPVNSQRVRYHLLDGPQASFLPNKTQEGIVVSDANGNASITLAQPVPRPGVNHIAVEILGPPDPAVPGDPGIVLGHAEATVEWQAAFVALSQTAPPTAAVGQDLTYTITLTNTGQVETHYLTVRDIIPDGLTYVSSQPPANVDPKQLIWTLGALGAGQSRSLQVIFRPTRSAPINHCVTVVTDEGLQDQKCILTQVTVPQLKVTQTAPTTAALGVPIPYQITVTNAGTGPATHVLLKDEFDAGLTHASKVNAVELSLVSLPAGASHTETLVLTPQQAGKLTNRVVASADGGLTDRAEQAVTVQDVKLGVKITGRGFSYVGRSAEWSVEVTNPGENQVDGVELRDSLPAELVFQSATEGGLWSNGQVTWKLGLLKPHEQKTVQVKATCAKATPKARQVARASASSGVSAQDEAGIEVRGVPAFRLDVVDLKDPVEVGSTTSYRIDVVNEGSLEGNQVQLVATIPTEMRVLSATGPAMWRQEGANLVFAPVDHLAPKATWSYTVVVQALQPATVVLHAELRTATSSKPIVTEEPTRIYQSPYGPQVVPAVYSETAPPPLAPESPAPKSVPVAVPPG
jgi:uncharacterized repeat protein (TIGR01451 family)